MGKHERASQRKYRISCRVLDDETRGIIQERCMLNRVRASCGLLRDLYLMAIVVRQVINVSCDEPVFVNATRSIGWPSRGGNIW
jgi:hypothetical protein